MGVMVQSSGNFQKLVGLYENPILEYWQDMYADEVKNSMIPILFDKVQSDNPTEAISSLAGAIDFKEWNGEFTYSSQKEGDTKVWTPIIWQAGRAYDRFLLSNAKLVNLKNDHGGFAIGAARTRENCAAGIFMYADQTSYVVNGVNLNWTLTADGLPLASHVHTMPNASGVQDNLLRLDLSEENLEAACQTMFAMKDNDGNYGTLNPDTLVVPLALRKRALEIIGADGKSDTADNNPNVFNGSLKLVVWDKFRKQAANALQPWCVVDSTQAKQSAKFINRLESGDDYDLQSWKNEETQSWKIGSILWYSAGMYTYQPYVFSIPA
jgi:hypothetical protein